MTLAEKETRKAGKQFIKRQRRAAAVALEAYIDQTDEAMRIGSIDTRITHLIVALHHLADRKEIAWKEILHEAKNYYSEDRNDARGPKADSAPVSPRPAAPGSVARYYGVPGPDGVTQTIHEVVLQPIPPPAPGLHPAPLDGPRRSDEIAWVRDYLVVHLNQAGVPPKVQPNMTELDGWAAQVVDHLVRVMIRPDGGGLRGMINLTEAPPPVPPIDPTQNEIRWMVGDQVRINKQGHGWHALKGEVEEVSYTGVRVSVQGQSTRWFDPSELIYLAGRPDNPAPKADQLHANAVRAAAAAFPDPGGLAEALATSAKAAENAASWEGAWPDPQRPARPNEDEDENA